VNASHPHRPDRPANRPRRRRIEETQLPAGATRLANGERGDERGSAAASSSIRRSRLPSLDGWNGAAYLKSVRQLLVANEDRASRRFREMHAPLRALAPACLSESSALPRPQSRGSRLGHLSTTVIRLPDGQFSLHLIQDPQPVRLLRHVQRVEERLRFHIAASSFLRLSKSDPVSRAPRRSASAKNSDGENHRGDRSLLCVKHTTAADALGRLFGAVGHERAPSS